MNILQEIGNMKSFKGKIFCLILLLFTTTNVLSNIHPWFALSSLWGQGSAGLSYYDDPIIYTLKYDFVYGSEGFTYHEVAPYMIFDKYSWGIRYRWQLDQDEYAPYVGYFLQFKDLAVPISLYNELEYRINSVVKSYDYYRSRHILTFYAPLEDDDIFRPYFAIDSFINLSSKDFEKTRLNLGYFIYLKSCTVRVYFIPVTYGNKEEEWDDDNSFGASVIYKW
jgi:hypothetical protein